MSQPDPNIRRIGQQLRDRGQSACAAGPARGAPDPTELAGDASRK